MSVVQGRIPGVIAFVGCLWALQNYAGILEFDRQQIVSGELWRIWTGHLVHTNLTHFALNVAAAILLGLLFSPPIKRGEWLLSGIIFAGLIGLGLFCLYPDLDWYNGLSGLLHAWLAYFSIRLASAARRLFWMVLAAVWVKVAVETLGVQLGYVHLLDGMTIITEAHLLGAVFGTAGGLIGTVFWREKRCKRCKIGGAILNR